MLSGHCRPAPVPSCAGSSAALSGGCCAKKLCTAALKFSVQPTSGFPAVLISQQHLNQPHEPNHIKSRSPSVPTGQKKHRTSTVPWCWWAEQFIPHLFLLETSPAGNSRSEYWWSVCVWRGTPLRSAASPHYCSSKCRNPCLSCRLAVPIQYSPGTDITDRLSNNLFYYYYFFLLSLQGMGIICVQQSWQYQPEIKYFCSLSLFNEWSFIWYLCPWFRIALVN